jgi:RNA polymerase sigma factor (sigma-70 family)
MTQHMDIQELQSRLLRYCLTITESVWEAEDLVQETCLKAIGLLNGSSVHANPIAYLLRIAKNTRVDQIRKDKSFLLKISQMQPEAQYAHEETSSFEIEAAFQVVMQRLSPMQRSVFLLRDVFGFTNTEAAKFLKTTEGAVKVALHRARCALEAAKASYEGDDAANWSPKSDREILRSLISAFQLSDVPLLVQLSQNDSLDPAMAIGMAQRHLARKQRLTIQHTRSMSGLQLAA